MLKAKTPKRFIPSRVVGDTRVPKRYRRSGWLVFDTRCPIIGHLFVNTRSEALAICDTRNTTHEGED